LLLDAAAMTRNLKGISQDGHATMPRFDEELGNKA